MSAKSIVVKLREAYRIVMKVAFISFIGFFAEFIFALISSSFILYSDVVHWIIDGVLEVTTAISLYLASRVYKRFSWNILYVENFLILTIALSIFVFYMFNFVNYINEAIATQYIIVATTTNPLLAIVTAIGGLLTLFSFQLLYKGYKKLGMEIIKAEYIHALIDIIASITATIGIIATSITRSIAIEITTVIFILFFVFHSITDLILDSFKSFLGIGADPEIKYRILTSLNNFEGIVVKNIDLRKIGSFYIVRIECLINPTTTILKAHKLRLKIIEMCREISELIYHVDVIFYPYKPVKRSLRSSKPL